MKHTELLLIAAAVFAAAAAQAQPHFFVSGTQAGATVTDGRQPRYIRLGTESSGWYGNRASVHITYSNLLTYKGKRLYHTHKNSTSFARFDEIGRLPLTRRLFDGIVNRDDNGVTVTRLYRMYSPIYRYVPAGYPTIIPTWAVCLLPKSATRTCISAIGRTCSRARRRERPEPIIPCSTTVRAKPQKCRPAAPPFTRSKASIIMSTPIPPC